MSTPLQPADLALALPLNTFFDHFQCPICLGEIASCHLIQECGHQFCESCIRECLNRKKHCPLCQVSSAASSLVRNRAFDQLLQRVRDVTKAQSLKLVKKLLPKDGASGGSVQPVSPQVPSGDDIPPAIAPLLGREPSSALSPIELLFREHITSKALLPFEEAWQDCKAKLEKARLQEAEAMAERKEDASHAAAPGGVSIQTSASSSSWPAVPNSDTARAVTFASRSLATVVSGYESYLLGLAPPALIAPLTWSVVVQASNAPSASSAASSSSASPGESSQRYRLASAGWQDLEQLVWAVVQESRKAEYPSAFALKSISLDASIVSATVTSCTKHPSSPSLPLILNPPGSSSIVWSKPFHEFGLQGDCELMLKGSMEFIHAAPPTCFMQVYKPDADQRVDYFKCATCGLNWICKSCSISCHSGHSLQPFMLNHKPTYAACYCNRKRACQLQQKK